MSNKSLSLKEDAVITKVEAKKMVIKRKDGQPDLLFVETKEV